MRCSKCGQELGPGERECSACRELHDVKVLSPQERENFQGVTLESEPPRESGGQYYGYDSSGPNHRVHVRSVRFTTGGMSLWSKLAAVAVVGLLVFVFLPLAVLLVAGASLAWFLYRALRR